MTDDLSTGLSDRTGRMTAALLHGGGATGELIRAFDWSRTPLGPIARWPAEVRAMVQMVLASPVPMVVLWGADGLLLYNDGYAAICGERHPAALGASALRVWPEAEAFNTRVLAAGMAGEPLHFAAQELELIRDGEPQRVWMDLDYTPIRDAAGRPVGTLAMVIDITQRVLAERRLATSEAMFRFLDRLGQAVAPLHDADEVLATTTRLVAEHLHVSNCAYADMDADENGFTIRGNWHAPGTASIVGHYSLADFGTLAVDELSAGRPLIINDNLAEIAPHEAKTFQDIGVAATICMPLRKDGRLAALMAIHDRVPHHWTEYELAVIREVTERSWAHVERVGAEANLRRREEQLRLAIEAAEVGLWDVDQVAGTLFWQPRVKAMFGIAADVPVTMQDYYDGLHPDDFAATAAAFAATADPARRAVYEVEYRTVGKEDGVVRWVAAKGRGVFEGDACVRVIGTAIDITDRKAVEQALRDLNETLEQRVADALAERKLFADLVENTDAIIQVLDRDYRVLAINRAAVAAFDRAYGVAPTVGASILDLLSDRPGDLADVRALWDRALAGEAFTATAEFGLAERERRWFDITFAVLNDAGGTLIGAYQMVRDVTDRIAEQKRLAAAEDQLRQAQKVEALGQLTGGVAHDFNNLLTPIIGTLDLLHRKETGTDRERRLVEAALQSAERAKTLVQRLLAFARRQPLQPTAVAIDSLIAGMAELIESTTGPQIHVVTDIAPGLPAARGDWNQLEMALLNLSVNARDAMPDGGTLRISAQAMAAEGVGLRPGDYVRISVADTGTGMDAATLAKAIEPFFSTKGIGKGTGLGLSMVHGLAEQLGGALRIFSRPGVGTNVELWLPASEQPAVNPATEPATALPAPAEARGIALLVDDEPSVRAIAAHALEEIGFVVVEYDSAEAALAGLREGLAPAVLVTDHLMPGMNGTELVRVARGLRPDMPALIVSGYADVEEIAPDLPRLTKPFRSGDLAMAIAALGV